MEVIWHAEAKNDLKEYYQNSNIQNKQSLMNYINSLINYTEYLKETPYIGKIFITYKEVEIRQVLFKMHRIIYFIKNNEVVITKVIHTSRNIDGVMKYLNRFFNK